MSTGQNASIKLLSSVRSNLHMCSSAVLVSVKRGANALSVVKKGSMDWQIVLLRNKPLVHASVPNCGTCGDSLCIGYGEHISEVEVQMTRDALNGVFTGVEAAVKTLAPLLGLLSDGVYLIADHLAFPGYCKKYIKDYYRSEESEMKYYFWNGNYFEDSLLHQVYYQGSMQYHNFPAYLYASQSAKAFDIRRMMHYYQRLEEGNRFPRAICLYLSGGFGLMLDGHHKAAAAAYAGENVRCLSICPVFCSDQFAQVIQDDVRLYLTSDVCLEEARIYQSNVEVQTRSGEKIAEVLGFIHTAKKLSYEEFDRLADSFSDTDWGEVPEEYYGHAINNYPDPDKYSRSVMIPRNRIKEEYERFFRVGNTSENEYRRQCLISYCEVFKDQKWISPAQYERLLQM